MNEELRERLARAYYDLRWTDGAWDQLKPQHKSAYYEMVDAVLAEIEASGMVIVMAEERAAEHDCDKEYRADCACCNGVSPEEAGTW